jgi:hypothetical protein
LVGFADIKIDQLQLVINDVALHQKNSSRWAALPAKARLLAGTVVVDPQTHKIQYVPVLAFEPSARSHFSDLVWAAVTRAGVLEGSV